MEQTIQRLLAERISRGLGDRRLGLVSVSRVALNEDLRYGTVYLSVIDGDPEKNVEIVRGAAGMLRREVGRVVRLRHVPELRYCLDERVSAEARIEELLREAEHDEDEGEGEALT